MRRSALVFALLLATVPTVGAAEAAPSTRILVAYHSETGNTEALADLVQAGAASVEGVEVWLRRVDEVSDEEILQADGVLLGSPVHWSTVSVEARSFLDRVGRVLLDAGVLDREGRTAGAFCTGGGAAMGKEMARLTILNAFLAMRFVVVGGVEGEGFGTLGPEATTPNPKTPMTSEEESAARASGERFARLTRQLRQGAEGVPPTAEVGSRRFGKAVLLDATQASDEERRTLSVAAPDLGRELSGKPPLRLQYHDIRAGADGMILPWYHDDPAVAYDHVVRLVWDFWRGMEDCPNGVKYYLQHQVWKPEHDPRGLGGDQISMALSSWNLLHQYLGDPAVVADMRLQADYWIENGFTGPDGPWPNLPFPYNTDIHSGRYDGDMIAGKGFVQPDKAGSFGTELVTLYKLTGKRRYLGVAVRIADTLARNARPGDQDHSPWPYRVHFETGNVFEKQGVRFTYTTNWTGALRLFDELIALGRGRVADYEETRTLVSDWLKSYPLKTLRWGPFFEDISTYSDTQINAGTMARYILEHPHWMRNGEEAVRRILDDCDRKFGNPFWAKYGVRATNEQTAYEVPGNSHSSRQNSLELMWSEATGDWSRKEQAIRNLNWATYMVAEDGRNRYYRDDIWLTDGYGDYVRHYLRAMAAAPELAPPDQNHLLRTTSVIQGIDYGDDSVTYEKWDADSRERLKLGAWEPGAVQGGTFIWDAETRVLEVTASTPRVVIRRAGS